MDLLIRIKRLVLAGAIRYTYKALDEMANDGLQPGDVIESIVSAESIDKVMRSHTPQLPRQAERLYVIKSRNYNGTLIYTKGKISREAGQKYFYVLISAKIAA